jgi:hypothetical protein
MLALSAADVLRVWEHAQTSGVAGRAVALVRASSPGDDSALDLPIGRRDARLLALREGTFGPRLDGVSACPACGETVEFSFATDDVRVAEPVEALDPIQVEVGGRTHLFRLPTTRDLMSLPDDATSDGAQQWLMARCAIGEASVAPYSDDLVAAVSERFGEADPQADVRIELRCAGCDHAWVAPFDIVAFLWREVQRQARRLLDEVHVLAARYAWSESDILALSPARRQAYLELAAS